jgi:hypothetical protein
MSQPAAPPVGNRLDSGLIAVGLLTGVALALRLRGVGEGLYHDELFTYAETHGRDFGGMLDAVANGSAPGAPVENTPPLHFTLAWLSSKLGDPTETIRLPSIVLGAASVPLVYALGRRTVGTPAALFGAVFMALSPFAIFYGIEARAYGPLMFFAALSALVLLKAVEERRRVWWAAYAAAVAGVLYTHYLGVIVIATEAAWMLWVEREQWRSLALAYLGAAVLYVPWLPHVHSNPAEYDKLAGVVGVNDWSAFLQWIAGWPDALPDELPGVFALVLLGVAAGVGLIGAVLARAARWGSPGVAMVLLLAVTTPIVLLVYGVVAHDLFVYPRNMSAALPFVALGLGWLLTRPAGPLAAVAVALAVVTLVLGAAKTLEDRFHRPNSPAVARELDDRLRPGDPVVYYGSGFNPFIIGDLLRIYLQEHHPVRGANPTAGSLGRALERVHDGSSRPVPVVYFGHEPASPVVAGWDQLQRHVFAGNPALNVSTFARLRAGRYSGLALARGKLRGAVDSATQAEGALSLSGWALTRDSRPADHVLAFVGDRLVAATVPTRPRPDVSTEEAGFVLDLPASLDKSERASIRVIATDGKAGDVLDRYCSPTLRLLLGC